MCGNSKVAGLLFGQGVTSENSNFLAPCSKETTNVFVILVMKTKKTGRKFSVSTLVTSLA